MRLNPIYFSVFYILIFCGCADDPLPKPKAQLRLEYPTSSYKSFSQNCPFSFFINEDSNLILEKNCNLRLDYPRMNAAIYLTYKPVDGNLKELLLDAEKLTYEHVVKANTIAPKEYQNKAKRVYGMYYEVTGDAASQSQFYVTDSTQHFMTGSLYFYSKPNYDSVYPAAVYLQNDIRRIMESIEWR